MDAEWQAQLCESHQDLMHHCLCNCTCMHTRTGMFSNFGISQEEFETLATGAGATFCSREGTFCTLGLHAKWRPSKALPSTATCPQEWKKQRTTDTEEPYATVSEPITWAMAVPWKKVPHHSHLPTHLLTASLCLAHQALPVDLTHSGNPPKCSH